MKQFNKNEITKCCLLTRWRHGETPIGISLSGTESLYTQKIKNKSVYKYDLNLYGQLATDTEEAYLVYSEGDHYAYHPKAVFINEADAEAYKTYWNDDAGIMATGEYQFIEKIKILK